MNALQNSTVGPIRTISRKLLKLLTNLRSNKSDDSASKESSSIPDDREVLPSAACGPSMLEQTTANSFPTCLDLSSNFFSHPGRNVQLNPRSEHNLTVVRKFSTLSLKESSTTFPKKPKRRKFSSFKQFIGEQLGYIRKTHLEPVPADASMVKMEIVMDAAVPGKTKLNLYSVVMDEYQERLTPMAELCPRRISGSSDLQLSSKPLITIIDLCNEAKDKMAKNQTVNLPRWQSPQNDITEKALAIIDNPSKVEKVVTRAHPSPQTFWSVNLFALNQRNEPSTIVRAQLLHEDTELHHWFHAYEQIYSKSATFAFYNQPRPESQSPSLPKLSANNSKISCGPTVEKELHQVSNSKSPLPAEDTEANPLYFGDSTPAGDANDPGTKLGSKPQLSRSTDLSSEDTEEHPWLKSFAELYPRNDKIKIKQSANNDPVLEEYSRQLFNPEQSELHPWLLSYAQLCPEEAKFPYDISRFDTSPNNEKMSHQAVEEETCLTLSPNTSVKMPDDLCKPDTSDTKLPANNEKVGHQATVEEETPLMPPLNASLKTTDDIYRPGTLETKPKLSGNNEKMSHQSTVEEETPPKRLEIPDTTKLPSRERLCPICYTSLSLKASAGSPDENMKNEDSKVAPEKLSVVRYDPKTATFLTSTDESLCSMCLENAQKEDSFKMVDLGARKVFAEASFAHAQPPFKIASEKRTEPYQTDIKGRLCPRFYTNTSLDVDSVTKNDVNGEPKMRELYERCKPFATVSAEQSLDELSTVCNQDEELEEDACPNCGQNAQPSRRSSNVRDVPKNKELSTHLDGGSCPICNFDHHPHCKNIAANRTYKPLVYF